MSLAIGVFQKLAHGCYGWAACLLALCLMPVLAWGQPPSGGRRYGLFVGIDEYPEPENLLAGCANDARTFHELLTNDFGFSAVASALLVDGKATRANILAHFNRFRQDMRPGDVFVFYYSGHGYRYEDQNNPYPFMALDLKYAEQFSDKSKIISLSQNISE